MTLAIFAIGYPCAVLSTLSQQQLEYFGEPTGNMQPVGSAHAADSSQAAGAKQSEFIAEATRSSKKLLRYSTLRLGLGYGTVGDWVDYSPNLPEGGFSTPVRKPRYQSYLLSAHWQGDGNVSLGGSIARRNFTSLRDDFNFNSYRMSASVRLPSKADNIETSVNFSVKSNAARQLNKNSFTQVEGNLVRQVSVNEPNDLQWHVSLSQKYLLNDRTQYGIISGIGQTFSRHRSISGTGVDASGCTYNFHLDSAGGTVNQRDACGAVQSLTRVYPNGLGIERDLNVAPKQDMQNNSWFYRVGGELATIYGHWTAQLAFYHQRYLRDSLDNRIRQYNGEVHNSNNVVTFQVSRSVSSRLSYSVMLEYNQHQFLDELPVLYTRLTANRFAKDVVHMTMRIQYNFDR